MSKAVVKKTKTVERKFEVDCSKPVQDKVLSTSNFAEFLRKKIKVRGRCGRLGEAETPIKVTSDDKKVSIVANIEQEDRQNRRGIIQSRTKAPNAFSKRYLKYLTKKFLKKNALREFLYVVASSKANYVLKYFNIQQENNDAE